MGQPSHTPTESLTVRDERTGKTYSIPITDNSIPATAFKAIKAPKRPDERDENETERGLRVSDKGFLNTAVIQSEITYIDGDNGILRYRGYPIEQLATQSSFLEVAYLLIYGSLPSRPRYAAFESEVLHHSMTHVDVAGLFRAFRYDAHPMSILTSAFAALGSYYAEANPSLQGALLNWPVWLFEPNEDVCFNDLSRVSITSTVMGEPPKYCPLEWPTASAKVESLSYPPLACLTPDREENYTPSPVLERALDILFILHADHELNASATTVLQTGSSLVDPYSAIAAGCGANEAVIRMLISIGSPENVPAFLESVKKREKVLSGFGHRVYKTSDPRSFIIRQTAEEVFKVTGQDPLLETAMRLHDLAIKDEYFVKRKLAPNVDFWSGLIYRAMGFPLDFFPVLFAVPRVVGWLAHWRQMMLQPGGVKIWRPRQVYMGPGKRDFVPMDERPVESDEDVDAKKVPSASLLMAFIPQTDKADCIGDIQGQGQVVESKAGVDVGRGN
ncbi:hypothetical protein FRC10_001535 [Ceratobasidium sp. 414]|nr:hypothetical protein FRC10_001535 [Ceratobasidium sp. 414]